MGAAKAAAQQTVKASAAALDVVRRPDPGVVVLIYHRVGCGSALDVDLPRARFDDQMAWLAASGRVTRLGDALDALAGPAPPSGPLPVVVTFDDGTADFAEHAVPVLERYRVPVTLYLATAFVDERRDFPNEGAPISWSALRDVCSTGLVDVGSHTHNHVLLDRLAPDAIDAELDRSIALIGEHVGDAPLDFAYPKAVLGSPPAQRAVRARFRSAAVAGTRPNPYGATDAYRLQRSPVQASDGHRWFVRKAAGGLHFEDDLRRRLNRRRYAAATT